MLVSISTGCLHHLPPDRMAEVAQQAGFRHVELLLNDELSADVAGVARALASRGLVASVVHAPFYLDGLLSAPGRQRDALAVGVLTLEAAEAVGASTVTVHPGKVAPLGGSAREYEEAAVHNLEALGEEANRRGIELLLENTRAFYVLGVRVSGLLGSEPAEMERLLGPPETPRFRMTFDTSHAFALRVPVDGYLRQMGPRVANVHLSDANGFTDHLPLGHGRVDFTRVFAALRAIGFDGNATLEIRPHHASVAELRRNRVLIETELARIREHRGASDGA